MCWKNLWVPFSLTFLRRWLNLIIINSESIGEKNITTSGRSRRRKFLDSLIHFVIQCSGFRTTCRFSRSSSLSQNWNTFCQAGCQPKIKQRVMALIFLAYWFMIGIPQILAPGRPKKKSNKIEKHSSRGRPSRRQLDDEGWDADSQASSWESLLLTKFITAPHIIWSGWNQVSILACEEHKSTTWFKSHDNTSFLLFLNCSREYSLDVLTKRT